MRKLTDAEKKIGWSIGGTLLFLGVIALIVCACCQILPGQKNNKSQPNPKSSPQPASPRSSPQPAAPRSSPQATGPSSSDDVGPVGPSSDDFPSRELYSDNNSIASRLGNASVALMKAKSALPGVNIQAYSIGSNVEAGCCTNSNNPGSSYIDSCSKFPGICVDTSKNKINSSDWATFLNSSKMDVIRLPVHPLRIVKDKPSSSDVDWCGTWNYGEPKCVADSGGLWINSDQYGYMSVLQEFLEKYPTKFFIIDMHDNVNGLSVQWEDGSGFDSITLIYFWQAVADYVNQNLSPDQSSRVLFEIYNEPRNGDGFTNATYAETQAAIIQYCIDNDYPNICLVGTYGNYTSIKTMGTKVGTDKDTLTELVTTLQNNITPKIGSGNATANSLNSGILIVFHQYCNGDGSNQDGNYLSGQGVGCSNTLFSETEMDSWIDGIKSVIDNNEFYVCQTEGNVMVSEHYQLTQSDYTKCSEVPNGDLYATFLNKCTEKFGSSYKFYTLWSVNQWGIGLSNPGGALWNPVYAESDDNNINTYSYGCIYGNTGNTYLTTDGKSGFNNSEIPDLTKLQV